MTSIFKSNKFFRIIKHFVLTIPLMFVLGTSIYTIVNPNAKDSYYGETINEFEYSNITLDEMINGHEYYILKNNNVFLDSNTDIRFYITGSYTLNNTTYNDANNIRITSDYIKFFRGGTWIREIYFSNSGFDVKFTFDYISRYGVDLNPYLFEIVYTPYSYLNNAFEYGMYQFNQVGFYKFDFVGLFDGIFTDNIHNVYTDFINSYLNYYLMIECVYFVPWVIHMFIHFAYDLGDYFTSSFRRKKEDD